MERLIDLHTHSTCSDGRLSPRELVAYAAEKGAYAIALTDHDTVAGLPEALEAGREYGVKVLPGMELSAAREDKELHILGLGIAYHAPALRERMAIWQRNRRDRNEQLAARFRALGIPLYLEDLACDRGESVTRAHFARWLMERGYVRSISQAFALYLNPGGPCYIPRERITPQRAIQLILDIGGVPVLAHPMLYTDLDREALTDLVAQLKEMGLQGIETYYSDYTPEETAFVEGLAARFALYTTGGSDFHGDNKPGIDLLTGRGNLHITSEVFPPLEAMLRTDPPSRTTAPRMP